MKLEILNDRIPILGAYPLAIPLSERCATSASAPQTSINTARHSESVLLKSDSCFPVT
jgi:hypothetical protein